jgi:hypothetical protein
MASAKAMAIGRAKSQLVVGGWWLVGLRSTTEAPKAANVIVIDAVPQSIERPVQAKAATKVPNVG